MANGNKTTTSTQIRNFYSEGVSYLNVSFFNTKLCFKFYPFIGKENNLSKYDMKNGQSTSVDYEGAAALYQILKDIDEGKIKECNIDNIPCTPGATLKINRSFNEHGVLKTVFSINKNNVEIPYVFNIMMYNVNENGQMVSKIIETGVKALQKTIDGYLTGINADRHLDKLTDDFIKAQENNGGNSNPNNYSGGNNGNYKNNYRNNYKKPYNNNNGNRPYNGNSNWEPAKQQNLSSYQLNG